jgi:hypothetical protein
MGGKSEYRDAKQQQRGAAELVQTHRFSPVGTVNDRKTSSRGIKQEPCESTVKAL